MTLEESEEYTKAYLDPDLRKNPTSIQVLFCDGTATPVVEVEYPVGHAVRRKEGIPLLVEKFKRNVSRHFPERQQAAIFKNCLSATTVMDMPVNTFTDMFVT